MFPQNRQRRIPMPNRARAAPGFRQWLMTSRWLLIRPVERTKRTPQHAEVRVIDVPVDVVIGHVAVQTLTSHIRQPPDLVNIARAIERNAIFVRQALARLDFLRDGG